MKKVEKRHKQQLEEYTQKNEFDTVEKEELIRFLYRQQELEDISAGYDLGIKRLHIQNLYIERMEQLFEMYSIKV